MISSYQVSKTERKKIPLYLQLIALDYHQEPINRPSGINFPQWFVCTSGVGEVEIDGKKSIIHPGDGLFIAAHTPHKYRGIEGDFILNTLGFNGNIVPKLLLTLGFINSGVYQFKNSEAYIEKLRHLEKLTGKHLANEKYVFSSEIYNILLFVSQNISKMEKMTIATTNSLVNTIIDYLEKNYNRDLPLAELSAETGKTTEYLCKVFKKEMQTTIVQYLMEIRVANARILLCTYPEKTASEIGNLCGFQSPSYFGKIFKKYMKMSPNEYRARNM